MHLCGRTATVTCVLDLSKRSKVDFDKWNACWRLTLGCSTRERCPPAQSKTPEAKFKVGDYVTLKEGIEANKKYGGLPLLSGPMHDFAYHKQIE